MSRGSASCWRARRARCRPWHRGLAALVLVLGSACDHGLDPGPQGDTGLSGRITFQGEWPPDIAEVAVAVYERSPRSLTDFLQLSGYHTGLPPGSPALDYAVPLQRDGVYEWVIVAWRRPDSFWDFTSLLGCYHAPDDDRPTPVPVALGKVTTGVDIAVDLAILAGGARDEWSLCTSALQPELVDEAAD
ncbi:MAG: hypothetical protein ABIL09_23860 [Gemmatimonadota bacterium]